ncbi:MAG: hypothetical protein L0Y56_11320 [Nitrospira sp.]|nr:hypothetical protein [Nitrospira sp.]
MGEDTDGFHGKIVGISAPGVTPRFVTITAEILFHDALADLNIEQYYIRTLLYPRKPGDSPGTTPDVEDYGLNDEDQNEAFENIQQYLLKSSEEETGADEDEEDSMVTDGPRRVEATFIRDISPFEEYKAVIVDVIEPSKHVGRESMKGRIWEAGRLLSQVSYKFFYEEYFWISSVTFYERPHLSEISTFTRDQKAAAWRRVRELWGKMAETEKRVVQHWAPSALPVKSALAGDDEDDDYGNYAYSGLYPGYRGPSYSYVKPVAVYRVSGDTAGQELLKKREPAPPKTPRNLREILRDIEGKDSMPLTSRLVPTTVKKRFLH